MAVFTTSLVSSYNLSADTLDDVGTNNLTNTGIAFTGTDIFAANALLDGVADQAQITDAAQTGMDAGTGSLTVECWFYMDDTGGDVLVAKRGVSAAIYQLDKGQDGQQVRWIVRDASSNIALMETATNISTVTKYHVVAVVDRATQLLHLYLNGVADGTPVDCSGVGSLDNAGNFAIGYEPNGGTNFFAGQMARVRLWIGRVITANGASKLYNNGSGLTYAQLGTTDELSSNAKNALLMGVG